MSFPYWKRHDCVIPFLEALSRWFGESSVCLVEHGLPRAIYTVVSNSWSAPSSVWFGGAVHSPTLGTYEKAVGWLVPSWS
jgi:hypothetical protein